MEKAAKSRLKIPMWQKLLVMIMFVIIGVVFILGYIAMKSQGEVIEQQVLNVHEEIASVVAQEINAKMETAHRLLSATSRIPDVQSFNRSAVQTIFKNTLSNFRIFTRMSLLDREGNTIYTTLPRDEKSTGKIWYTTLVKGNYDANYVSELRFISGNLPAITMALPVRDKKYRVTGIIVSELDLRSFWPLLDRIKVGKKATLAIVDNRGKYLAHSKDKGLIGHSMPSEYRVLEAGQQRVSSQIGDRLVSCISLSLFQPRFQFGGYVQPNWQIVLQQDRNEAYSESIRLKNNFVSFAIVAILIAIPISLIFSLTFTRHIKRLVVEAHRLSAGELDKPVEIKSRDEVGELSEAFEEMRRNLKKKMGELGTLITVGQEISSVLELSDLLKLILSENIKIMNADRGSLMLFDDETGYLRVEVSEGLKDEFTERQTDINAGVAGKVFRTGKDILIKDALKSPELKALKGDREIYPGALLSVPLKVQERTLGVLNVSKSVAGSFDEQDLELFNTLSLQGAIAIDNAILYKLATTDGMTKLYLHRYFQQRMDQEIKRSERYNYNFSLIMMDIDHFKNFNDNFGHQNGDKVLKIVAQLVMDNVREIDIAARYGGEEFAVICPEKSAGDAITPAERIRQAIEGYKFYIKDELVPITISLGISGYPEDAHTKLELIDRADKALYFSKEKGRNATSSWSEIKHLHEDEQG